jgi:hypothetical protein
MTFAADFAFDDTYTSLNMASKTLFTPNQQRIGVGTLSKDIADTDHNNGGSKVLALPDDYYRLKVLALMPFGDDNQSSYWTTWTSPLLRLSIQSNNNNTNSGGIPRPRESPYDMENQQTLSTHKLDVIQEK